jgi:hypothetical protein
VPRIELDVGEAVVVTFKGTDGEITVAMTVKGICVGCREYVAAQLPLGISIHDMPDSSGRTGVIYHEAIEHGYVATPKKRT